MSTAAPSLSRPASIPSVPQDESKFYSDEAANFYIKSTDMNEILQEFAFHTIQKAYQIVSNDTTSTKSEKCTGVVTTSSMQSKLSKCIKKDFDSHFGGVWHCIVGKNFGSHVVHDTNSFLYAYFQSYAVLIWKSGIPQMAT